MYSVWSAITAWPFAHFRLNTCYTHGNYLCHACIEAAPIATEYSRCQICFLVRLSPRCPKSFAFPLKSSQCYSIRYTDLIYLFATQILFTYFLTYAAASFSVAAG